MVINVSFAAEIKIIRETFYILVSISTEVPKKWRKILNFVFNFNFKEILIMKEHMRHLLKESKSIKYFGDLWKNYFTILSSKNNIFCIPNLVVVSAKGKFKNLRKEIGNGK